MVTAAMKKNGRVFYTTNLPGGGAQALWTIDTRDGSIIGAPVPAPFAGPHNLALTPDERKLYLTHSGPTASTVSVFTISNREPVPVYLTSVGTGVNPFGITYVP